jgi:hypothetical protein
MRKEEFKGWREKRGRDEQRLLVNPKPFHFSVLLPVVPNCPRLKALL